MPRSTRTFFFFANANELYFFRGYFPEKESCVFLYTLCAVISECISGNQLLFFSVATEMHWYEVEHAEDGFFKNGTHFEKRT